MPAASGRVFGFQVVMNDSDFKDFGIKIKLVYFRKTGIGSGIRFRKECKERVHFCSLDSSSPTKIWSIASSC